MKIKWHNTIESTISAMEIAKKELADKEVWAARCQTAGRGQRGNVWHSEPGANLTFSVFLIPDNLLSCDQFLLCQEVSLGVCRYLAGKGIDARIKWPNDIYVGDRKICGILIEHDIAGAKVKDTIAGIGINLNQTIFPADVPNPTSVKIETGLNLVPEDELPLLLNDIFFEYDSGATDAAERYTAKLYLKDTPHTFTVAATGDPLEGCITGVAEDGRLMITDTCGAGHRFAFKEIVY